MSEEGFVRIRIKESDHERITKRVTYHKKIHDVVTDAMDALNTLELVGEGATRRSKQPSR